ncbi:MAG: hypothetical protein JW768_03965 [Chitinispirillaceae bacterium]|nr:hypothetical protein [Chitinispirillaceae bacterium]
MIDDLAAPINNSIHFQCPVAAIKSKSVREYCILEDMHGGPGTACLQFSKSVRLYCAPVMPLVAAFFFYCQPPLEHEDPARDLIEFESVWQLLSALSIWQENVPDDPFVFPSPETMMSSIGDTLRGIPYTRYFHEELYHAEASLEDEKPTVFLDALTATTALLTITSFGLTTWNDFLETLPAAGRYSNFIIDVRQNRGGYLDVLDSIIGALVPPDTPFIDARYRDYDGTTDRFFTRDWHAWETTGDPEPAFRNKRFAVLMDGYSASASEILIAALYEGTGAALIGDTSYGKGIGQIHIGRRTRETVQITFLMLKGHSDRIGDYHRKGIAPDPLSPVLIQEAAALDSVRKPIFYAVKTLDPFVNPLSIRYPPKRIVSAAAPPSLPSCIVRISEEEIPSLSACLMRGR